MDKENFSQICPKGHETDLKKRVSTCICGEDLNFKIPKPDNFLNSIDQNIDSMWRYKSLLPIPQKYIITSGEGNTPIVYLEDLSKKLGINLYAKIETENPTGTFKDREASFVVSRSLELGQDNIVLQSTGNTAMAVSYYAGLAGISSWTFIPEISSYKLKMPNKEKNSRIIAVRGSPKEVKDLSTRFSEELNFPKVSPFHERCESNVTQAYEVYEGVLRGKIPEPDFYAQVISAGMAPIGFFHGVKRIQEWGFKIKTPKIICIQNSEFSPMNSALIANEDKMGPEMLEYPTKAFEPTLHTTNAKAYYPHIKKILKESEGMFPLISPEIALKHGPDIVNSLGKLGFPLSTTENAPLISYAGVVELTKTGQIPQNSNVLLMITGKSGRPMKEIKPDAVVPADYDVKKLYQELK